MAEYKGGYTSFSVELTNHLNFRGNGHFQRIRDDRRADHFAVEKRLPGANRSSPDNGVPPTSRDRRQEATQARRETSLERSEFYCRCELARLGLGSIIFDNNIGNPTTDWLPVKDREPIGIVEELQRNLFYFILQSASIMVDGRGSQGFQRNALGSTLRDQSLLNPRRTRTENRARPQQSPQLSTDSHKRLNVERKFKQNVQEAPRVKDREPDGIVEEVERDGR